MRKLSPCADGQRGSVAVAVALSLLVLIAFLGVVVDLGRLYVIKAELQNAADACALAAAKELNGTANALTRAENAGITIGTRNLVNFQSQAVSVTAADISFATALSSGGTNSNYQTQAAGAPQSSKYAMCTLSLPGIPMSLTSVVGFGPQVAAARAVATVAPAQTTCAIPVGLCTNGGPPTYGMTSGSWITALFGSSGQMTGNFNWLDFNPPAGGNNEIKNLLGGTGQCASQIGAPVGQTGAQGGADTAWNSRFGLYKNGGGNPQPSTSPPDFTGYSYTPTNWPSQSNALPNFLSPRRVNNAPYEGNAATGLSVSNAYKNSTGAQLAAEGADRRLVVVPMVNCAGWATSQTVPILSYACMLMLHPIDQAGKPVRMEYIGQANDPASPCSTSGLAGGAFGPLVPVLVQ